jgi:UDP-3-O-[3-hydroxymyristoyl] N-acetylglucosamine deacetylase
MSRVAGPTKPTPSTDVPFAPVPLATPLQLPKEPTVQITRDPMPRDARAHLAAGRVERETHPATALAVQRTLKAPIGCTGIGLHSGARISLRLLPGAPDSGIVFRRTDLAGGPVEIPARYDHVVDTRLNTTIGLPGRPEAIVGTVEHLMAALAGMGVDNAVIEIDGAEVPAMDGSAAPFVFLIECAGTVAQDAPRQVIEVLRAVRIEEGDGFVALLPGSGQGMAIEAEIDFAAAAVRRQSRALRLSPASFKAELSAARTFGFAEEVEALRAAGLARGGSLKNAIVVSGSRVLNEGGLRFADEFVRHKMLDQVGDLALAGFALDARVVGRRPGHRLNNRVLHALFADASAWRLVPAGIGASAGVSVRAGAGGLPVAAAAAAPA